VYVIGEGYQLMEKMDGSRIGEQIRTGHQPHGLVFDASGMVAEIHHNSWKDEQCNDISNDIEYNLPVVYPK
ncbi:hypothetical protein Tco_1536584, partial [Tanacetum coccineum]